MSALSLARNDARSASVVRGPAGSPDLEALELVERLVLSTRRANETVRGADPEALHAILETRQSLLEALGRITLVLAAGSTSPASETDAAAVATRAELVLRASEFQRANMRLMQLVTDEAARLSASIAGLDRDDTVGGAYRANGAERSPTLDLVR